MDNNKFLEKYRIPKTSLTSGMKVWLKDPDGGGRWREETINDTFLERYQGEILLDDVCFHIYMANILSEHVLWLKNNAKAVQHRVVGTKDDIKSFWNGVNGCNAYEFRSTPQDTTLTFDAYEVVMSNLVTIKRRGSGDVLFQDNPSNVIAQYQRLLYGDSIEEGKWDTSRNGIHGDNDLFLNWQCVESIYKTLVDMEV